MKEAIRNYLFGCSAEYEEGVSAADLMVLNGNQPPTLFCRVCLEYLDQLEDDFKKDTRTESFIYFKNCFVSVTRKAIPSVNTRNWINLSGKTRLLS